VPGLALILKRMSTPDYCVLRCVQVSVLRLHQEPAVQPHKRRSDRAAVGSDTADEGAAFSRQEMHVSFDIAHRDLPP